MLHTLILLINTFFFLQNNPAVPEDDHHVNIEYIDYLDDETRNETLVEDVQNETDVRNTSLPGILLNETIDVENLENLNAIERNLVKKITVPKRQRVNNQFLREFTKEYSDLKKKQIEEDIDSKNMKKRMYKSVSEYFDMKKKKLMETMQNARQNDKNHSYNAEETR